MPSPNVHHGPRNHFELIYFLFSEVILFMIARILSVSSYYAAVAQLTRDEELEKAAYFNPVILLGNWIRIFSSNVVPQVADASMDDDLESSQKRLKALYKTVFTSTIGLTVATIALCQLYTSLVIRLTNASENTIDELFWLPATFFWQLWLLMLMATQTGFVVGLDPKKKDLAILVAYGCGAAMMYGGAQAISHWKESLGTTTMQTLMIANGLQLLTVDTMMAGYLSMKHCGSLTKSLFMREGWSQSWGQSWEIYKKSVQPAMIYFWRAGSQMVMVKILNPDALKAYQALNILASTMEAIALLFEPKMTRFVREILKRLGNQPKALGSELRWTMFYLSLMIASFPTLLLVLAVSIPNFFKFFLPDDPALINNATGNIKVWALFAIAYLNILIAVARGTIYGARNSSDEVYSGRINNLSTVVSIGSAILFPAMTLGLKQAYTDEVACAWISLFVSQLIGAGIQMAVAIHFTRHETKVRLAKASPEDAIGDGALGCCGFFRAIEAPYVLLRNMPSARHSDTPVELEDNGYEVKY